MNEDISQKKRNHIASLAKMTEALALSAISVWIAARLDPADHGSVAVALVALSFCSLALGSFESAGWAPLQRKSAVGLQWAMTCHPFIFASKIAADPAGSATLFWESVACSSIGLVAAVFGPEQCGRSAWLSVLVVACVSSIPQAHRDGSLEGLTSTACALGAAWLFDFLLRRGLNLFKKTFTFGEAVVVAQALSMYSTDGLQKFSSALVVHFTSPAVRAQVEHEERVVMQGGILAVLLSVAIVAFTFPTQPICSEKKLDTRSLVNFWCALAGCVVGLLTLWMVSE
jgi:hypothetical protein